MTTKLQKISELMEQTISDTTNEKSKWADFLKTAAWLYKYPFQDQLLIYAQRPEATACASIELWNKSLQRWVNRGAKGIALIDDSTEKTSLKYVFDVSDTHDLYSVPFRLWEIKEDYKPQVIEEISHQFGDTDESVDGFENQLINIIRNTVEDNYSDYFSELLRVRENSFMEELDDFNVGIIFKEALAISITYGVFTRLGLDADMYFHNEAFECIYNFNTFGTVMQLGSAMSDISEMILRQVERTVKIMEKQERDRLATSNTLRENITEVQSERNGDYGGHVLEAGGLSDSRFDAGRTGDKAHREIRDAKEDISAGTQKRNVLGANPAREIGQSLGRYRPDSKRAGETDDGTTLEEATRARQGDRADGLGGAYEQPHSSGGGIGAKRPDIQLKLPTEQKQIENIVQAEDEKSSAFSISQQNIDYVLIRGSNVEHSKIRIYQQYQKKEAASENIRFLKEEYGIGGGSVNFPDGSDGFEWQDAKGLRITVGRVGVSDYDVLLSWAKVNKRITELIETKRYMNQSEIDEIPAYEQWLMQRQQEAMEERAASDEKMQRLETARLQGKYNLAIGNAVYVEHQKYEILSVDDDSVILYDSDYPLINLEMQRNSFISAMQSSTRNDYLLDLEFAVKAIGEPVTLTLEGETVTIDGQGEEEKTHVEIDVYLPENKTESLRPIWEKTDRSEFTKARIDRMSETAKQQRINFRISNDELGHGGTKTKYGYNTAAIRTLKKIENEHRLATPQEQEILSSYVGWGGLPQAFDEGNSGWSDEFVELRDLLTEAEYASARESTLNAHYTSPAVIKAIYQTIENMGFKTGNVLEPSCGIGNFFGLLPETMKDAKLYGVELDDITGRIAKQLYQNANIAVEGYEKTNLPDSFFDLAIGNVPFGSYGVADKRYDKNHFLIHDFFFAKTLDKVRPGGIIAFITSSGTMDKKSPSVRKYIAQRAELLGAIRLPNNAFLANAGTQVVADIIFLQKRDRAIDIEPEWVHLDKTEDGYTINRYFTQNLEMILGNLTGENTQYGRQEVTVVPIPEAVLFDQLKDAIANIHAEVTEYEHDELEDGPAESIPASPDVRNFSFCIVDDKIYFRENSKMNKVEVSVTAANRIKGMVEIRDCTRRLIDYQLEDYSDEVIQNERQNLNVLYDIFTKQYGLLNSRGNEMAFSDDSSYCLLCSLEILDENGELERNADMFSKRTIRRQVRATHVDTASEALAVSLSEKACVDIAFMCELSGKTQEEVTSELVGVIFKNPISKKYETADEYLSGNVREKLKIIQGFAENEPEYLPNVSALKSVQPKDLTASDIDVRLGATWLPQNVIENFVIDLLKPSWYARNKIRVHYSQYTSDWNIAGKSSDTGNVNASITYGTSRINAYKIIEDTLNLRDVRIFDTVIDAEGKETRVLNKKETILAQQKQQAIKDAFREWVWEDAFRRDRLTTLYNERFNSMRPREYNGSHLTFPGMNPEITLRPHQQNAIARTLYGENTMLAHCVGAGKTFEMVASAMESRRLGLCQKSLIVVPNHLTEQWAAEFLQLYPSANILVATKKDFETRNRKKFCGRIATGDYEAVIIGHSQFEKIPMSVEQQRYQLEQEIEEITNGIADVKNNNGERFTIKQMEKTRKNLKLKLDKLNDTSRKDDVVTFEELGVDKLFVDESHFYKNLFLYTKMRNVAGLAQTEAQKSSDLFMKCRFLDRLTGGKGIVFGTGTPISNSMTELYTNQRYLQYETLCKNGLQHFDSWASTFGETITAIELAPEGTGYRMKTRFAKFYNLPELIAMFKQVADIQTEDMLNLPVPETTFHNEVLKPSGYQRELVAGLAERAERVRNRMVEPTEDNMLKITNDGRKLALEQRLINEGLPDEQESKVALCIYNIHRIWKKYEKDRLSQLVFCDLSTPHYDGSFNVYDDIKKKLIMRGIPENEIAFIHDANTEAKKAELFTNVRKGQVRILLGSTFKMGAGTNVQQKLYALHHLDIPWRPSDIAQREGRIKRQGNKNKNIEIFRYVTENTFDSYMWQTIENKQKFSATRS